MSLSEQMKSIKLNRDVSDHRFFNAIAMAVKNRIEQQIPELKLHFGGKAVEGSSVMATLTGEVVDETGEMDNKVRQVMDSLKNPATLLSGVK